MSGMKDDRRFFIAVKGIIVFDGKFLIVRRSENARAEIGYWELPGGRLEFGETTEDALRRELREEVGLEVEILRPMTTWSLIRENQAQTVGITFLCRYFGGEVTISHEHDEFAWINSDEILGYNFFPNVAEDLRKMDWNDIMMN